MDTSTLTLTRVEQLGDIWMKRDDTFEAAGVSGGKVRTCWSLARGSKGLVTAGSRSSPQANIVASVAAALGVPCRIHTPGGDAGPEVALAIAAGAERVEHRPGYNSVIVALAHEDAVSRGWTEIPFGMECQTAVDATSEQVGNIPAEALRLVVPVGSGMSLSGILWGLARSARDLPVLGVYVGADPIRRLDKWAPPDWRDRVTLLKASSEYAQEAEVKVLRGVPLDPHYEAKLIEHVRPGDCVWVVGIRQSSAPGPAPAGPVIPGTRIALPAALVPLLVPIGDVHADPGNPRRTKDLTSLCEMFVEFGFTDPVVVAASSSLIEAGHQRHAALLRLGATHVPVVYVEHDRRTGRRYNVAHNRSNEIVAEWDQEALSLLMRELHSEDSTLSIPGFGVHELDDLLHPPPPDTGQLGRLSDLFVFPPFSVLDARGGAWQDRRRAWVDAGIAAPVEPDSIALPKTWISRGMSATSIFDPVVAELAVRWFSRPGDRVIDPFAGGAVRGLVSGALGREYRGIDLRRQQVDANESQLYGLGALQAVAAAADEEIKAIPPAWTTGDGTSADVQARAWGDRPADLILSCPPYGDLEVYSDDPADISNMPHAKFEAGHAAAISAAVGSLAPGRFAVWVIGDFRDKKGLMRDFVSHTIAAFRSAGASLYNEAILVTPLGSVPARAGKAFASGRKLAKTHQQVLVFVKGEWKDAVARLKQ